MLKKIPTELNQLNEDQSKWEKQLKASSESFEEVKKLIQNQKIKLMNLKSEYDVKQGNFQKSDKDAFQIYRKLEQVEEELNNLEKSVSKHQNDKIEYKKEKLELDKYHLKMKLDLEQEIIILTSVSHDLSQKKQDLDRINKEIGPLIIKKEIIKRSIEEINRDIELIEKKLLRYFDVDESIVVEKEEIMKSLKDISKNQKDLKKDITSAIKTEKKMEDTYYKKFQLTLDDLQSKVNGKFKSANIKSYASLALTGNIEDLGIEIKAATSKDQLKYCSALSGGQISMVSICLILSLQEIKPSPLCMFDEAGMFLDEKNSEASYRMIKDTIEQNMIQMLMFLPKSSDTLYLLADKLIGVARVGKEEISTIFKPKILKQRND
jgi:chromosome segregation protein